MRMANIICLMTLVFLTICFSNGMPPNQKDIYKNLIDGKGLYEEKDMIEILNSTNIKSKIFGTDNSWLVEFYNSWCGHCFMFAPKWRALASDVYSWRKVIRIGAIDCSTEENNPICRDYDVMGYPTIKFFHAQSGEGTPGTELTRDTIGSASPTEIETAVVGILKKEQMDGRGEHWPNLVALRSSDLGHLQRDGAPHVFVVFEHGDSIMGTQLILDMSHVEEVQVRSADSDNEALAKSLGVRVYPSVVYVPHGRGEQEHIHPQEQTREGYRNAIRAFLTAKGINVPEPAPPKDTLTDEALAVPNLGELMKLHYDKAKILEIKKKGDVVYLADLETALRYMLNHEIPVKKLIKTEAFEALQKFLTVIAKYFPAGESGIAYLQDLRDSVSNLHEIRGVRFKSLVKDTKGGLNSVLSTEEGYIGCRGSEPHLRGFPCGVWTLFHYLTISALRSQDPLEVVSAMLGYITYFFGCTECSVHFQEMAGRSMRAKSTDAEQAALWLWAAHNEVNARLSGAATEDREYPKIQYPSPHQCPKCRDSVGRWAEPQVLQYLRSKYHQDNLNYKGANTQGGAAHRPALPPSNRHLVETAAAAAEAELHSQPATKYFSFLDLSLCVALYGLSAFLCAALFWKFVLRRHYRRKLF